MRNSHILKRGLGREEYGDTDPAQGTPGGDPVAVSGGVPAEEPVHIPEVVPPEEVNEDSSLELDIQASATEDIVAGNEMEEVAVAQESLRVIHGQIKNLIETGQCNLATEALIATAIDNAVGRLHQSTTSLAQESLSAETDVVERHRIMMESISMEGEFTQHLSQGTVLRAKHNWNAIADFFRSTGGRIGKYRAKLQATRKEYDQKKGKLKGEVNVSQNELWYHFTTNTGPVEGAALMGKMKADVDMSTFVLAAYPKRVLEAAKKASQLIAAANLSTAEGVAKLAAQIERLPTAVEMFDKKFVNQTYFSVKSLEINEGKARQPLTVAGKSFARLAELAARTFVEETGSTSHSIAKAAWVQLGGLSGQSGKAGKKFSVRAEDIGHILDAGDQYLKNVDAYIAMEKDFRAVTAESDKALSANAYAAAKAAGPEAAAAFAQIEQYFNNLLLTAFASPAKAEMARSIKSAKYNMYLANRAIYNAD